MKTSFLSAAGITVAIVAAASFASAQTRLDGFAVNTLEPSERGGDWFALETLDYSTPLVPTFGIVGDLAHKPLVFHQDDEEVAVPIENQLYAHLGASVVLSHRVLIGLSLPVALIHDGNSGNVGSVAYETDSGTAAGDLRLSSHVRLFGNSGEPLRGAVGLLLHFPTGRQEMYVSDGKMRAEPRFELAGDVGALTYAGRLGVNLRPRNEDYLNYPFGSQLTFGAAAGVRILDKKLVVGPELYGSTVISDGGDGFMKRRVTPVDLLMGGHYAPVDAWKFGLGAGPGLTRGWGSPDYRIVASIEFSPEPGAAAPAESPSDRDGDHILDDQDACPDQPGPADGDPAKHGCPPEPDQDGDTISDLQDACPTVAGPPNLDREKNGCPPPGDRDGDGILDPDDACPDKVGPPDEDRSKNGCPKPSDRDKDGIDDEKDACPDQAGPSDPDPKKNGCPKAQIVGTAIRIAERVKFDTGQATLRPESDSILDAVANVLKSHPEIKKLNVQGHTDNRGTRAFNLRLSQRRAVAVVDWLVNHGVEAGRLTSAGLGPDKPVDTNDTDEGRQNNRRVEFQIVK
jgi:OmpA-OmpF porin, OOP family